MIALIGNRPAIQVGKHQVHDYDTDWLGHALERAAAAADTQDFPFLEEIRKGIEEYLESQCSLRLLPLPKLFERIRRMLEQIGCKMIAEKLEPLAPPVTFSLQHAAHSAGNGFELAFFETLRNELQELRSAGAEEVHFTGLNEAILHLCGGGKWNQQCDLLLTEIRSFLWNQNRDHCILPRPLQLHVEGVRID